MRMRRRRAGYVTGEGSWRADGFARPRRFSWPYRSEESPTSESLAQRTQWIAAAGREAFCAGDVSSSCGERKAVPEDPRAVDPVLSSMRIRSKGPRLFEALRVAVICRGTHVNVPLFRCIKRVFDPALQIAAIRRTASEDQQHGHSKGRK